MDEESIIYGENGLSMERECIIYGESMDRLYYPHGKEWLIYQAT